MGFCFFESKCAYKYPHIFEYRLRRGILRFGLR